MLSCCDACGGLIINLTTAKFKFSTKQLNEFIIYIEKSLKKCGYLKLEMEEIYTLNNMTQFINSNLEPMSVNNNPWLYERLNKEAKNKIIQGDDSEVRKSSFGGTGKWMLYFQKDQMNLSWELARQLLKTEQINGVRSMKCSTGFTNPRSSCSETGIIIFYCNNSDNEQYIIQIGKNILDLFKYKEQKYIYFKTDEQTEMGTIATGNKTNSKYKLENHLLIAKKIDIMSLFYPALKNIHFIRSSLVKIKPQISGIL